MSKKQLITLTVAFLAVVGIYFYLYKDSFGHAAIQISHTIRPQENFFARRPPNAQIESGNLVTFRMDQPHKLTSIKVISVPELETNKYAHPVWELASDSNSVPIQLFAYGMHVRGMHPQVKGATADPLLPNVPYRLFVEAGSLKGEHDFTIVQANHAAQ